MANVPDRRPELRVSDADRDRVAVVLREAHGQGRIPVDELEERLSAVYAAKTFGDLEPVTSDLPEVAAAAVPEPAGFKIGGAARFKFSLAIMGGSGRSGNWVVPRRCLAVALMGGVKLDLREASFAGPEATIHVLAIMGGVEVVVPEDLLVEVSGLGLMGGVDHSANGPGAPGAPRVKVSGLALMGGFGAKRRRRKRSDLTTSGDGAPEIEATPGLRENG